MDNKLLCECLQKNLHNGGTIWVRVGESLNFSFDIDKDKVCVADLVIYLNYENNVSVVWNNHYRRECGSTTHNFSWEKHIDYEKCAEGFIVEESRKFQVGKSLYHEKVMIMDIKTFAENCTNLYDFLFELEQDDSCADSTQELKHRGRKTITAWNRSREFRRKVLDSYDNQCAICRCSEVKLLEAAHIVAVNQGGSDDIRNGICLCANHHKMLDEGLIKVDFKNLRLSYVSKSVQVMPWYNEFTGLHKGELLQQNCRCV